MSDFLDRIGDMPRAKQFECLLMSAATKVGLACLKEDIAAGEPEAVKTRDEMEKHGINIDVLVVKADTAFQLLEAKLNGIVKDAAGQEGNLQ